jgi:hypothetical protein
VRTRVGAPRAIPYTATVAADPEATGALRKTGRLADGPPTGGVASPAAIDDFFRTDEAKPSARKERRAPVRAQKNDAPVELRARKVHRIVRHVEPWSVLKISLIFYFCLWIIMLVAAAFLWRVASGSGVVDNVESFIEEIFALEEGSFALEAGQMFRAYAVGGLVMVVAATGFTVLLAVLFNLISDLTGGVRVSVLEEESALATTPRAEGEPARR